MQTHTVSHTHTHARKYTHNCITEHTHARAHTHNAFASILKLFINRHAAHAVDASINYTIDREEEGKKEEDGLYTLRMLSASAAAAAAA